MNEDTTAETSAIILPAGDEHLPECERLWWAALPEMSVLPSRTGFAERTTGEDIFVALTGSSVVGFVSIWRPEPFIHFLVVDRVARRCGVGSALLQHAVQVLGRPVELKCELHNLVAQKFYERHGWREADRVETGEAPYILYRLGSDDA